MNISEIGNPPRTLVTATDNHVWWALREAKRSAEYKAANAKKRIDALGQEIQRHTRDLLDAEAVERAVTAHAESQGWTLELERDKANLLQYMEAQ